MQGNTRHKGTREIQVKGKVKQKLTEWTKQEKTEKKSQHTTLLGPA